MLFEFVISVTAAIVVAPPQNTATLLTLILLMWRIGRAPNNTSKWRMRFNSACFDIAEKSACVSGVDQCTATKRRLLKIENVYLCDDD